MFHFQNKKAFTLIEMLVVVVIIGILAGVLVPRLVGAKERANDSARIVKVWQISSAVELYAQDSDGTYPKAPLTGVPWISVATPIVTNAIAPYLSTIPTDPGKWTVAIDGVPWNIQVTGDSFAYWTDIWWKVYAVTALMESKKGNTTNAVGVVDSDKQWSYQVVGKWLIINILPSTPWVHYVWNDIVVTDGTRRYVLANKNVWADVVGTWPASYWRYFQRGNNYWFPNQWNVITGTILVSYPQPGYNSDTFIKNNTHPYDWATPSSDNLRTEGSQWPCLGGYHIPTKTEWQWVIDIRKNLSGKSTTNWRLFSDDLKLPIAGRRHRSSGGARMYEQSGIYWSSTPYGTHYTYEVDFSPTRITVLIRDRAYGFSIRCFKN